MPGLLGKNASHQPGSTVPSTLPTCCSLGGGAVRVCTHLLVFSLSVLHFEREIFLLKFFFFSNGFQFFNSEYGKTGKTWTFPTHVCTRKTLHLGSLHAEI